MLNSSSHGNNDLDDQVKQLKEKMAKLKKERNKYKLLHGELEYKFVVKEDDDMKALERKQKNLKEEAKKAKIIIAKVGATRTTAENMKAYGKRVTAVNPAKLTRDATFKKNDIVHVTKGAHSFDAVVESRLRTRKESYSVVSIKEHKFYNVAREDMTLTSKAKTPKKGDTVLVLMRPDAKNSEFVKHIVQEVKDTTVTVIKVINYEELVIEEVTFDTKKDTFVIVKPSKKRSADPTDNSPTKRRKVVGQQVTHQKSLYQHATSYEDLDL